MLAVDNAIALAARNLPKHLQRQAIVWGAVGAIAVRVLLTVFVVWLLRIPGLMFAGGALLIWSFGNYIRAAPSLPRGTVLPVRQYPKSPDQCPIAAC